MYMYVYIYIYICYYQHAPVRYITQHWSLLQHRHIGCMIAGLNQRQSNAYTQYTHIIYLFIYNHTTQQEDRKIFRTYYPP